MVDFSGTDAGTVLEVVPVDVSNEINPINGFNSNDYWNSHIYAV